jgi:uncharacterized membrane protein (DUF485 family)
MKLFKRIKGIFKKDEATGEDGYEYGNEAVQEVIERDSVNMDDEVQRTNYVKACLEQMAEASKELDVLGGEYDLVTSYLTDMEEIEAQPPEILAKFRAYAKKIVEIQGDKDTDDEKRFIMTEEEYSHMESIEQYMPEGVTRLKETEDYQLIVKQDMAKLDGERHAYYYRRNELINSQRNMKGITSICVSSMLILIIVLAILSSALELDVVLGYVIAVLIMAVALVIVYVKYHEAQRELVKVEKSINKLVQLQNTVKIKYVNNTNLLEYLYMKYDVNSSTELKKLWDKYIEENNQREKERQMQADMDYNQAELIKLMRRVKISEPNIWLHQAQALLDNGEMVELRHSLIIRRQKLRKQMEYNAKVAQQAQDEVKDIVDKYPKYAKNILDLVADYEKALA